MIRSHVLNMLLQLVGLQLLLERRWRALAVLGFTLETLLTYVGVVPLGLLGAQQSGVELGDYGPDDRLRGKLGKPLTARHVIRAHVCCAL